MGAYVDANSIALSGDYVVEENGMIRVLPEVDKNFIVLFLPGRTLPKEGVFRSYVHDIVDVNVDGNCVTIVKDGGVGTCLLFDNVNEATIFVSELLVSRDEMLEALSQRFSAEVFELADVGGKPSQLRLDDNGAVLVRVGNYFAKNSIHYVPYGGVMTLDGGLGCNVVFAGRSGDRVGGFTFKDDAEAKRFINYANSRMVDVISKLENEAKLVINLGADNCNADRKLIIKDDYSIVLREGYSVELLNSMQYVNYLTGVNCYGREIVLSDSNAGKTTQISAASNALAESAADAIRGLMHVYADKAVMDSLFSFRLRNSTVYRSVEETLFFGIKDSEENDADSVPYNSVMKSIHGKYFNIRSGDAVLITGVNSEAIVDINVMGANVTMMDVEGEAIMVTFPSGAEAESFVEVFKEWVDGRTREENHKAIAVFRLVDGADLIVDEEYLLLRRENTISTIVGDVWDMTFSLDSTTVLVEQGDQVNRFVFKSAGEAEHAFKVLVDSSLAYAKKLTSSGPNVFSLKDGGKIVVTESYLIFHVRKDLSIEEHGFIFEMVGVRRNGSVIEWVTPERPLSFEFETEDEGKKFVNLTE